MRKRRGSRSKGRRAISPMSASGAETARSTTTNPARRIAERATRVTTRTESHPQLLPCETASSAARRAVAKSRPPAQSGRTDSRTGVSGTNTRMARNRPTATASKNQKTAATEKASTSTPPSSRPTAAPVPAAATSNAIQTGACSLDARSRASPMASGPNAAPMPCSTRPAISPVIDPARAQTSEPMANAPSETSRRRRFPYMSPRRPTSGAATTAASRKPVSSHVADVSEAAYFSWTAGRIGMTMNCSSPRSSAPTASTQITERSLRGIGLRGVAPDERSCRSESTDPSGIPN